MRSFPSLRSAPIAGLSAEPARTPFRSFADSEFWDTPSWERLDNLLHGNGGSFGLYGPRGSGKSWLMLRAIKEVENNGGMGLWFPCPSGYQPTEFLSALSDNLASLVERRYVRAAWRVRARHRMLLLLATLAAALIVVQVVCYEAHAGLDTARLHNLWIWLSLSVVVAMALAAVAAVVLALPVGRFPNGSRELAEEATVLRERIRYTTELKLTRAASVSGGTGFTASVSDSTQRSLGERPTTVASLVFDFRRLAEHIVKVRRRPLVIGIDELDKMENPDEARHLLRDIKGIFEIPGVVFLVSLSAEATASLQLGPVQENGRNEFSSSFYTVIELPPLSPADVEKALTQGRKKTVSKDRAQLLCLLSAGNWREMIRLSEQLVDSKESDATLAMDTLWTEVEALQQEIVRTYRRGHKPGDEVPQESKRQPDREVPKEIWDGLPRESFRSAVKFADLANEAIDNLWDVGDKDKMWKDSLQEPWRRLLIRLYVVGRMVAAIEPAPTQGKTVRPLEDNDIVELRDVLIRAERSTWSAKKKATSRFWVTVIDIPSSTN
jgi:Cdc6-like AAA superfamily ATPase